MTAVRTGAELTQAEHRPRFSPDELARLLGLPEPTPEQVAVIEAPLSPAVVIAGAGSGKTETMAARVVWLVANGLVAPERVLGLTFTRKAAGELQQRIRRRLRALQTVLERDRNGLPADAAGEPTVLTYAAYAGRLVDEHGIVLGREPGDRLLTEAARWQLADAAVRNYTGTFELLPGVIATVTERVLDLAGQLADHLATPEQVRQLSERLLREISGLDRKPRSRTDYPGTLGKLLESLTKRLDLLPLVTAFAERKRADGLLDFADHMVLASELAQRESIVAIERSRYDVVLLDEYQDTGYAQIQMLAGLFADGRAVTAVGDPLQSIYSWRGASAGNIGRFAELFRDRDRQPASRYGLMTSWRNDEAILSVANQVAGPLRAPADRPLSERPAADPGLVRVRYADTVRTEASWLAAQLAEQWQTRDDWTGGRRTMAVLVRKRSGIGLIAQAIRAAGLPVGVVDIGGLLTLPEVADVRAVLSVLADHNAGGSLARLLTGARWRIGPADLVALHEHARVQARQMSQTVASYARTAAGEEESTDEISTSEDRDERIEPSLIEALDDLDGLSEDQRDDFSPAGYWRLVDCARMLRRLRRRLELPLPDLLGEIERELGLDVEVAARSGQGYSALAGRANLDRFTDEAARFTADRSGASVTAFLGYLKAAEQEEYGLKPATVEVAPDRVQVLTVHGSKGLEWDVVAVAGLVRNGFPDQAKGNDWTTMPSLLPSPLRGDADQLPRFAFDACLHRGDAEQCLDDHHAALGERHIEEERRLAYVAFTRARKVLLASGACWGTGSTAREASTFLTELAGNPVVDVAGWHEPEPEEANPLESEDLGRAWPFDPLAERRPALERAAELVRIAGQRARDSPANVADNAADNATDNPPDHPTDEARHNSADNAADDATEDEAGDLARTWARDVDLLLAERAAAADAGVIEVALPSQLSVSDVVLLTADPASLARRLRRPLPQQPAKQARRGTAFHQWLEQRWSAQSLIDIDELAGAADELADDRELESLKTAFERSEWAERTPTAVEVGFEMPVGERVVRGRMDAVFQNPDGSYTVVDWKTGRPPSGPAAQAQAVQLALYRLAWARLLGLADDELGQVRAAFHYVGAGRTVAPVDLLAAEELRDLLDREPAGDEFPIGEPAEPPEPVDDIEPGFEPMPDASEPPLDAFEPPPENSEPPLDGFQPPPDDFEPPPDDFEPPPDDFEPPPDGFEPPPDDQR